MREILSSQKDFLLKLEQLEIKDIEQDEKISLIFEYLKQLEKSKKAELEQENRPRIAYKQAE